MKPTSELSDIELREAVAVEVMGWRLDDGDWLLDNPHSGTNGGIEMPCYEVDIEAAFEVVEKMREKGWVFFYLSIIPSDGVSRSKATFSRATPLGRKSPVNHDALGASLPRAICIAALTAVRARKT